MKRAPLNLLIICSLLVLAGAFAWRVPSEQERMHPRAALVLLSEHTSAAVPRVESARGVAGIPLPIEVLSGTGTATKSVTVNVNNGDGAVNRLWLQVHQPSYKYGHGSRATEGLKVEDNSTPDKSPKMWVRVNGGAWVKVDNRSATCAQNEGYDECIGGGFETVRFSIPVSGVKNGANTVEFYFNGSEGFTNGFRVLNFDFLPRSYSGDLTNDGIEAANAGRVTDTFVYENFSAWKAPSGASTAADVSAGKRLFETAKLVDFRGGPSIKATCSDCHAADGRDLKYFNFSNEVISVRAQHHGLSEKEGDQIAAYIRSLKAPAVGTPWDPPYQPGPTRKLPTMGDCIQGRPLDELPQHCWAAGAGLDWVLEDDKDMEPYLFPNGITQNAIDVDGTLNIRALPIADQFPDWNEWLPRVHPMDAWGGEFTSSELNTYYTRSVLPAVKNPSSKANGEALKHLKKWGDHYNSFFGFGHARDFMRSGHSDAEAADFMLGLTQWYAVKQWEVMTTYALEDMAPLAANYGKDGEVRSWVGEQRNVFDIAPHISWKASEDKTWPHGSQDQWSYFSGIWYQLQLTLNAGNKQGVTIRPVDWKYQLLFIPGREPLRYAATYAKMLQQLNNEWGVDDGDSKGWYWRHITPAWLFGTSPSKPSSMSALGPKEAQVATVLMQTWVKKTMRHAPSEWKFRPNGCNMQGLSSADYKPTASGGKKWMPGGCYADQLYRVIPALAEIGVAKSTLDSMATWGKKMWPKGDWDSLVDYDAKREGGATLAISSFASPALDAQYRVGEAVTFSGKTTNDGAVARMEGWANGKKLCEDKKAPFRCVWKPGTKGKYRATIKFVDGSGKALTSDERGFDVLAANTPKKQKVKLKSGWNTVSLSVLPADSSMKSVLGPALTDVVLVKDAAGQVYSPDLNVTQISHWSPKKAYMVYSRRDVDLDVEGAPVEPDDVSITLARGWNWVPYPYGEAMPIDEALVPVATELVLVTDAEGKVYYPESDINTIGLMSPGQGYKIYVEQACTLVYPTEEEPALTTNLSGEEGTEADAAL